MENLTLDFNNFGSRAALGTYEKCDSLTLTIVLDEKDYAGYKFKIVAKKSDGHIIEQDIKEQDVNREERIIKTELNNQFTTKEGVVKLEINMIKEGKEDTTKEAFFIVRDTINGEVVESTSIIPTLEGVKAFIDEAVISLGDLEQAGEDIALINGEFKEAEIKRKANELLRERSEKERVRLESIRTTEEADRIKAEAERKEAENNRKVAESNRKLAENTRKNNEAARVEAELNRQSLFEENEEIRNENENLRIEAEKERKLTFSNNNKFESERVEAEKLRAIAEDKRVTAEKARAKAEEERVKAETRRENTYTDFNDSEVERRNNEANRVRAEAERVNAESGRNELFNTNEEKRNSTFIESERTRERAFNEAQNDRNLTFEESERVREEAFKVNEAARNEAEEGRVAAELLRVEAEKLRVTAETGRVEAENLRVTAEEERVAAETKREEGFNKFDGKINANTKELKNARTATTGEIFDTLDERIDCEVDRLNKKIDVTMLQQEDKESHTIENTVEGLTTNMIIKGRTLQNFKSNVKNYISKWVDNGDNYSLNLPSGSGQPSILYGLTQTLKENQKYTVIVNLKEYSSGALHFSFMSSDGNKLASTTELAAESKGLKKFVFTMNNTIKGETLRLLPRNGINNIYSVSKNILVLEGDWTNKPVPNYFEGIKSFGQQEDKITILSKNKNLFKSYEELISVKKGQQLYLSSKLTEGCTRIDIQIDNQTDITVSDIMYWREAEKIYRLSSDRNKLGISLAVNRDCNIKLTNKYLKVKEYEDIQLEEGTQETQYEPYKCDKKDILLSSLGFDEGLRGIKNITDELNSIRSVAIKRIGKREYREGDLLLDNVITDKTNTYYVLEEPIETPLDENINVKTFGEKTYVAFENSISGTSSFKAPVNAAATISRLNRENRALEEENAKLKAETYKNAEDIIITNEELQIIQSAVDHLLFSNLNADGVAMLYNGKKKGGGSMGAYLAMRIIKGKLKYEAVMKQYGEFKEDIDLILEAEGYGHLITQQ